MSFLYSRSTSLSCLGYCGRTISFNFSNPLLSTWSKCGACPWGQRANKESLCEPCYRPLPAYDWMYLMFVALLPLLMHMQFIRNARKYCRKRIYEVSEHFCVLLENAISCAVSVLLFPPRFKFKLYACDKSSYREWYPYSYNPSIEYAKTMRCSYEVVFPLYSLPFVHHLILIASIVLLRSTLYCILLYKTYNGKPYYYSLISLPVLAGVHAFFAGFLYYSFPWILLMGSLYAIVYHLAAEGKRTIKEMIVRIITSPIQILMLLIYMLLISFSLLAIMNPVDIGNQWIIFCLVPIPLTCYLLTMPFSHPSTTQLYH